jgi:hypothetical protein
MTIYPTGGDDGMGEQDTSIIWRLPGSDSVAAHGLWMATCPWSRMKLDGTPTVDSGPTALA